MMLNLTVNGEPSVVSGVGAGEGLLAVLRDSLRLTGTKNARRASGDVGFTHLEAEEHCHGIPE